MSLVLYTCLLWLCTSGLWTAQADTHKGSSSHRGLAPTNVDFAFNLYQRLVALNSNKNTLISPVSISMALAMLSLGTRGSTQSQLLQSLGFNLTEISEAEIHQNFQSLNYLLKQSESGLEMSSGNVMFLFRNLKLKDSFSADIKHYYESQALSIPSKDWTKATQHINKYVESKTQGKIEHVFSDLESPATLILVSYIFLKGTWKLPFNPENTREEDFYVNETSTVKVPMMVQSSSIGYFHDSEIPCQLIQMNYVGNGTAFFILPDQGQMDTVIAALNRDTIHRWGKLVTPRQMNLYIPKFSISDTPDLKDVLADVGIEDLFTNQSGFSDTTEDVPLTLKVVHKAMLQLDEGNSLPDATNRAPLHLPSESLTLKFNKPFILLVFDKFTWSSLMMSKITNPA
ncbi:corticosteroid-binding globulin [Grammomys surdaster]|uniref:corticosteroid-binding globulin n=1 Tax=Grammomys surdaster TaxID=491861 RepID=UPI0010A01BDD|nr:corticosteroid-binding globulin [Grammomys surdaster]